MISQRKIQTVCPFCGLGDGLYLIKNDEGRIGIDFMPQHPSGGSLCTRGNICYEMIQREDRLIAPQIRKNGVLHRVSWQEAFNYAAKKLKEIIKDKGSNNVGIFSSAKITNEEAFVLQKFARSVLKTGNIDNPVRLCHAPTIEVLTETLGLPYATNTLQDLEKSDCVLIVGANPWEECPTISQRILRSKNALGKIIVVDPRRTPTTWHSDIHLMINPGTDALLILSFINCIISSEMYDVGFVKNRVKGFDELTTVSSQYSPDRVEKTVGVASREIREAALTFALAKRGAILYSHGITQHSFGTEAVTALVGLALITGNIGRPGAGLYPLMDQNNMVGVCDMGNLPTHGPGYRKLKKPGLSLIEMVEAAEAGDLKALYIYGVNPIVSFPNTQLVKKTLSNLDLLIVQDIFMTETAELAEVLLPSACWGEIDGTYTSIERRVQKVNRIVNPPGEAIEGWRILCELAKAMGHRPLLRYHSWTDIFNEIKTTIPLYSHLSDENVSKIGGSLIPLDKGLLYREAFATPDGKAHLGTLEKITLPPKPTEYPFILITGKAPYHHGSGSVTRRLRFPREEVKEAYIEISPEDAKQFSIENDDMIKVNSKMGNLSAKAKIARIKRGTLFIPYHFPTQSPNNLMPLELDPLSKGPELKLLPVTIEKES